MFGKKWWSPIFENNSYCYKMGHFYPNLGPNNVIALFLESTLRIFRMMVRHYSYIRHIEWNSLKYVFFGQMGNLGLIWPKIMKSYISASALSIFLKLCSMIQHNSKPRVIYICTRVLGLFGKHCTPCFIYVVLTHPTITC